jgi:hypothetical protein
LGSNTKETIMNIPTLFALALTLLAVSACIIEPIGGRGGHGGGHEYGHRDYGSGVWRG